VLSSKGVEAWRAAGCELRGEGVQVIAVRLLLQDCRNKDIGVFLVSAFAPVGVAEDLLWENFFNELDECTAKKYSNDILVIDTNSPLK